MSYTIVFDSKIEADLRKGLDLYDRQVPGLGFEFLLSVEAALFKIQREPLFFPKVYKNKRKANLKRFPFGVFYIVSRGTIFILAVITLTSDPEPKTKVPKKQS